MDLPYIVYTVDNILMGQVIVMGVCGGFMVVSLAGIVATACRMLIALFKSL